MKKAIRNFIIGKDVYIESRNEFRQVMLSGLYALVSLCTVMFYFIIEAWHGLTLTSLVYSASFLPVSLSIVMHRMGRHCFANALLFPALNILLLVIVSSEPVATCGFLFFFPLAIGSSAVFNHTNRGFTVFFVLLSFLLLMLSISDTVSLIPYRQYTAEVVHAAQLRNIAITFFLSAVAVYLLISLNHHMSKQLEESYRQTKELNEELDRFAHSTSHDLRAPLASVLGLLELSEKSTDEKERLEHVGMMKSRLASLDKFIKEITDYSRNKRIAIVKEDINLYTLVEDIWESLCYGSDARDISFINEIPKDLIVKNDGTRLRIALSNIVSNAIRYHDKRRERKYIRLYHQRTDTSFSIHIEDNGQGIAPEVQAKVFDMFFRVNEESQGSGLGLYIVKETIAKLSGSVHLTSIPKQGSTFSILIPLW